MTDLQLAIDHPDLGPQIRKCRILTPEERKVTEIIGKLKQTLEKLGDGKLDKELRARLEAAMDDQSELKALTEAYLDEEERLRMGYWPGEDDFRSIEEADLIAEFLIETYRPDLKPYAVVCLFQAEIPPANRRSRLGTAMKLPGKMKHVSKIDAVITLGFHAWCGLTDCDRQRLVHHELEHLEVVRDDFRDKVVSRGHDFEDFASIVQVYGIQSESGRMNMDGDVARAIQEASSQIELLRAVR